MATAISDSVSVPVVSASNGTPTDEYINGLVQGGAWEFGVAPRTLSYSFNINFDFDAAGNVIPGSGGNWTASLIDAVNRALAEWSRVVNVNFLNVSSGTYFYQSDADIAFTLTGNDLQTDLGAIGLGVFPDPVFADSLRDALELPVGDYPSPAGDVFLDNYYAGYQYLYAGGFGYSAILHEIGHALGLKHPGDDGGNARPTFESLGIAASDSERWTIMSNNAVSDSTLSTGNAASPMVLDILAMQQIYGVNMAHHAGDDSYGFSPSTHNPLSAIWDAGGIDTIDASAVIGGSGGVTIDLLPGTGFVKSTVGGDGLIAIAYNVDIENAEGSQASDFIFGNALNNTLNGRGGGDLLYGRGGSDTYIFGDTGSPTTFIAVSGNAVIGDIFYIDTASGSVTTTLAEGNADPGVDTLIATFSGSFGFPFGQLTFSTEKTTTSLKPGTYEHAGYWPTAVSPGQPGMLISGSSFGNSGSLSSYVDGEFTIHASSFDYSGAIPVVLDFSVSFELFDANGGSSLSGLLNINHAGSAGRVIELADEGIDTVHSAFSYVLPENVENLILTGIGNNNGIGNDISNVITGNAGNNILQGGGDNDAINGGAGVDNALYNGTPSQYAYIKHQNILRIADRENQRDGVDQLIEVEQTQFAGNETQALGSVNSFTALEYIASYLDLIGAFGANAQSGYEHFVSHGRFEGRGASLNALEYIATYGDLIDAFGPNVDAGATHYITFGRNEGRQSTFNALEYIASYGDLIGAFGANEDTGATHYITFGSNEGRQSTFNALEYIASYGDLIGAFGANEDTGAAHYITSGRNEGRTEHFDSAQYLANYTDLQAAFGTNLEAATIHFILAGFTEGRTDQVMS